MKRRGVVLSLVAFASQILAQLPTVVDPRQLPPPPIDPNEFRLSSDVELVLLDVSVKRRDGGFASDLEKDDFQVFENNRAQTISAFSSQDIPVTVGLVVDNSASVRAKRSEIVTAALTFVHNSNPHDEVFIVNFNDEIRMGLPPGVDFSDDRIVLRHALLTNPAQGRTALYDGIRTGLEHLKKGRRDKKTLIVISDGGDNSSEMNEEEILDMAARSTATIYTVGIYDPHAKDKNPGFLKELAKVTGGVAFIPREESNLVGTCTEIAHDIRNRYTIGYTPSDLNFDGKIRKLKVIAKPDSGEKLNVRTRSYYIAAPRDVWKSRREP